MKIFNAAILRYFELQESESKRTKIKPIEIEAQINI